MSEIEITEPEIDTERDKTTGRFLPGNSGFGGRPKGARSKFSQAFIEDLHRVWEARGISALEKCADTEPAAFIRTCASLMPKDVNLAVTAIDPREFVSNFRRARELLGNGDAPMKVVDGRKR